MKRKRKILQNFLNLKRKIFTIKLQDLTDLKKNMDIKVQQDIISPIAISAICDKNESVKSKNKFINEKQFKKECKEENNRENVKKEGEDNEGNKKDIKSAIRKKMAIINEKEEEKEYKGSKGESKEERNSEKIKEKRI